MIPMDGFELMAASPSSDDITLNYRDVESIDSYSFDLTTNGEMKTDLATN